MQTFVFTFIWKHLATTIYYIYLQKHQFSSFVSNHLDLYLYLNVTQKRIFESTTTCELQDLQGKYKSQLLRWQSQHPHYNEMARMLTQCYNRFLDPANWHSEVFSARRDCTWLRGFLYYLIQEQVPDLRLSSGVDWIRTAAPSKLLLARWTEEEWAAYWSLPDCQSLPTAEQMLKVSELMIDD